MKKILQTDRLLIRTYANADLESLFEICRVPVVMLNIGTGRPYTSINEADRFLQWAARHQAENGFSRWAVVERSSRRLIGSCGFMRLETGEVEIGYLIARPSWGKGYATEAAAACLKYGFEKLLFREIIALVDPTHYASQRVVEKIGLICRGIEIYDEQPNKVYTATTPALNIIDQIQAK